MDNQILILMYSAVSIAFIHTLLGPDHYLPFIALGKAKKWSVSKSVAITSLCGLGHVASSILIGFIGLGMGIALKKLEIIESFRGDIAAWLLTSFGFVYLVYGVRNAMKNKKHEHPHIHGNGSLHTHDHNHHKEHLHVHAENGSKSTVPWVLFIIFAFGPCEPLIPLLMFPAAQTDIIGLILVVSAFSIVTIGTMLTVVLLTTYKLKIKQLGALERYSHAMAGFILLLSGIAILTGL